MFWLQAGDDTARRNLRDEASARGVDSQRLIFAEFAADKNDHLDRLGIADLFLDAPLYRKRLSNDEGELSGGKPTRDHITFRLKVDRGLLTLKNNVRANKGRAFLFIFSMLF